MALQAVETLQAFCRKCTSFVSSWNAVFRVTTDCDIHYVNLAQLRHMQLTTPLCQPTCVTVNCFYLFAYCEPDWMEYCCNVVVELLFIFFLPRSAMHKRGLCHHAVSVCHVRAFCQNE